MSIPQTRVHTSVSGHTRNHTTVQAMVGAFSAQDLATISDLFAEDAIYHDMLGPGLNGRQYTGRSQITSHFKWLFKLLPSHHYDDAIIITSEDKAHANWTMVLGSQLPEHKRFRVRGSDYFELQHGEISLKQAWIKNLPGLALAIPWIRLQERFGA